VSAPSVIERVQTTRSFASQADHLGPAQLAEARGQSIDEADRLVRLAQQQSPRVRGHQTAVEIRHNAPSAPFQIPSLRATLHQHRSPFESA
jgi:hypothetical protein